MNTTTLATLDPGTLSTVTGGVATPRQVTDFFSGGFTNKLREAGQALGQRWSDNTQYRPAAMPELDFNRPKSNLADLLSRPAPRR